MSARPYKKQKANAGQGQGGTRRNQQGARQGMSPAGTTTAVAEEKPEPREPVRIVGKDQFAVTDEDFAAKAEGILERGRDEGFWKLTTSKLRGIYSLIMNIRTRSNSEAEFDERKGDIQYLKVRMAYEAGRESSVRQFLDATHLMALVDGVGTYEQFKLYCRYAEALVAYFKFFGGKD